LFINLIIDFIKKLFGIGSTPSLPSGGQVAHAASGGAVGASDAADEDEDLPYAQQEWKELQQLIQRVESSGYDLAGADPNDPVAFWQKEFGIEQAQSDGQSYEQAIAAAGYQNRDHHDTVKSYVGAKWSRLITNDDGEQEVVMDDGYQNAMIQARMGQMQGQMNARAAADPTLLEPVNGVTLEAYAGASAALGGLGEGATPQQVAELLGRYGMDKATYDAAAAGWQAKMQADTSYTLVQKYGEAFAAAQGQAGGWSRDAGAAAQGGEPCTFEHFVEIMAAQSAWAEQGMDVNAQLKAVFGITAMDYSKYSSYWSPKMGMDVAMMRKYTELEAKFKAKYAGAGMDDDLSL
jgi:hypothetical protein